jgi:hypothetical protein
MRASLTLPELRNRRLAHFERWFLRVGLFLLPLAHIGLYVPGTGWYGMTPLYGTLAGACFWARPGRIASAQYDLIR